MQAQLTLQMDQQLIQKIQMQAEKDGKDLSKIVSDYFLFLASIAEAKQETPITDSLRGLLKGSGLDESDYKKHLEEKYQ